MPKTYKCLCTALTLLSASTIALSALPREALASETRPAFVITHEPIPAELKSRIYRKPLKMPEVTSEDLKQSYYRPVETLVSRKIVELGTELNTLQGQLVTLSNTLNLLQKENEERAAEYYAAVATVNTQLQSGTTPGNPRLLERMETAESSLEKLGESLNDLNRLATNTASVASDASYLLESARTAYSLSGAVEEDHVKLAEMEDAINNTIVIIERLLNNVNDDITRTTGYLNSERDNLRTLSLAVVNGDLYGKSLSNRPFSSAGMFEGHSLEGGVSTTADGGVQDSASVEPRPLVKIRFDRADVNYEQPVYMAVNEALERYPDARFDLVAVHPGRGNAAQVAIESTRARRNAERVLRTLTQMGLPLDRIDLSYSEDANISSNEVHLYVR